MPNWNKVLEEINALHIQSAKSLDIVRRKYLKRLYLKTKRNTLAYYSGWLNKPGSFESGLSDYDKNGFMTTIHQLERDRGLDLILHTPGGLVSATESIVDYLHRMFGNNIRAIVPQLAMSGGTMIACACKEIIMGEQSNLGPIDPQFGGISAHGVLEEFARAKIAIKDEPHTIPLWQAIVGKYPPAFIGDCQKAMNWAQEMVALWLENNMFQGENDAESKVATIVAKLSDHGVHKSHDRHINIDVCQKDLGLKVIRLEEMDEKIQDLVLTIHHSYMHTFSQSTAIKIIENHNGVAMVQQHGLQPKLRPQRSQQ